MTRAPGQSDGGVYPLRRAILAWDRFIRARARVFDYSSDPRVILRLQLRTARCDLLLADGTRASRGARVLEIHFLNEHLPQLPHAGADLAWGLDFGRALTLSLRELQRYLTARPDLRDIKVIEGHFGFVEEKDLARTATLAGRFGLEFSATPPPGLRVWSAGFWQNVGTWLMVWAFNPESLKDKHFSRLLRAKVAVSRRSLDARFGGGHRGGRR